MRNNPTLGFGGQTWQALIVPTVAQKTVTVPYVELSLNILSYTDTRVFQQSTHERPQQGQTDGTHFGGILLNALHNMGEHVGHQLDNVE